jgi:mercuric ion transport protein
MMNKKYNAFWATLAFLTCPCHSVILLTGLAGTAGLSFFTNHIWLFTLILALLFALSLFMMFRGNKGQQTKKKMSFDNAGSVDVTRRDFTRGKT